ncbi:hypothetical protein [Sediminibacterium sp. KACHI17]|uniref:hypothetical protein n=1 Tax=Sediminibacterium sp. KACHI17 TaxID=1751071 RepID=UPI003365AF8F
MRLFFCLFLFSILLCVQSASASSKGADTSFNIYKGGIDSLHKHIERSLVRSMPILKKDYFLFFKILIGNKGVEKVSELYNQETEISKWASKNIGKHTDNWIKPEKESFIVVIPVFLFVEKRKENISGQETPFFTEGKSNEIIKYSFLIPPVKIFQYTSSH